jgi:hypothetical protein
MIPLAVIAMPATTSGGRGSSSSAGMPRSQAGVASAMTLTGRRVATALGLAANGGALADA